MSYLIVHLTLTILRMILGETALSFWAWGLSYSAWQPDLRDTCRFALDRSRGC